MKHKFFILLAFFLTSLALCVFLFLYKEEKPHGISLSFINEQIVDRFHLQGSPVGGLSALAYHPEQKMFLALSDDKGQKGFPPRFYKLSLSKKSGQYRLFFHPPITLKGPEGDEPFSPIDPEGIAFAEPDRIWISSEGAQMEHLKEPPAIFLFNLKGVWLLTLPLLDMYWPDNLNLLGQWGVQENKGFEALGLGPKKQYLYFATESFLHQDEVLDSPKQYVRINRFDIKAKKWAGQYVYQMDHLVERPPLKGFNGLTDFLPIGDRQFITLERAYLKNPAVETKRKTDANVARLFFADCSLATDVSGHSKLKKAHSFKVCQKSTLMDVAKATGKKVDNLEGIALGPLIAPNRHLLVLVSDNNFSEAQKNQFLFFELGF